MLKPENILMQSYYNESKEHDTILTTDTRSHSEDH